VTPTLAGIRRAAQSILNQVDFATDCGCRPVVIYGTVEIVSEAVESIRHYLESIKDAVGMDTHGREPQRSGINRSGPGNHG
jgi:hypothetical protein